MLSPSLRSILVLVLVFAALLWLGIAHRMRAQICGALQASRIPRSRRLSTVVVNSLLSPLLVGLWSLGASRAIVHDHGTTLLEFIMEVFLTLAIYDIAYYFMHRHVFHGVKIFRAIHAVHHSIKSPTVLDTFYVHPMETVLTVSLLFVVIMSVGPISVHAFGGVLAVVSCFNVTNHAGLEASGLLPRGVAGMVDAHMRHHAGMQAGNFASLTKLPDILFGTDE